jgi:hypothetical protein
MGSKRSKAQGASPTLRQQLGHIRASEKSGETLKEYAGRQGLSVYALYQAKKVARQQGLLPPHRSSQKPAHATKKSPASPRFAEAVALPQQSASRLKWRLRLASGDVLESDTALQNEELVHLISALRDQS